MQAINVVPCVPLPTSRILAFREQDDAFGQPPLYVPQFAEFYCQSGGSNLNGGSDTANAAKFTSTNGNWSTTTNQFKPTDGTNPVTAGVQPGDFASIYIDGATVGVFIARVISVQNAANGTITVDATAKAGTAPTTSATARSIQVGGAWLGPNAGSGFPLSLLTLGNLKDYAGHIPRFNLKNDASYSITTGIVIGGSISGPIIIQGYTSVPGDLGGAIIDGGTSAIIPLSDGGQVNITFVDLIVRNNGGTSDGFNLSASGHVLIRCVANNIGGNGFNIGAVNTTLVECEAYSCNQSNTAGSGGFYFNSTPVTCISCIAHDNAGSNNDGFFINAQNHIELINCISARNGRHGFAGAHTSNFLLLHCDAYYNGVDGYRNTNTSGNSSSVVRNCNFVKNGGYGINSTLTTGRWTGLVDNCGFGSNGGDAAHATDLLIVTGSIIYPPGVTPWVDPANGKFRVNLAAAIGAGRGAFTITAASYGPTAGYPDIGAAGHNDSTPSLAYSISGTTKDSNGNPLGNCTVHLFRTSDDLKLSTTISDANGLFTIAAPLGVQCYLTAYLAGSPDVSGTTINTLTGG